MQQLSNALHGSDKLLTAAVVSEGGYGRRRSARGLRLRRLAQHHGVRRRQPARQLRLVHRRGNFWKNRGLPKAKTVLGVPFYSRPGYLTYSQIVALNPNNANVDCVNANGAQQCYNGIPTIKRKTQWAVANAGGIMNWELSQDTTGSTSLVSAIFDAAGGTGTPPTGGKTGPIKGIARQVRRRGRRQQRERHRGTALDLQRHFGADLDGQLRQHLRALGKCMDITAAGTANGTKVQLYDCNGTGAQTWQAQSNGTLRNPASGRCLDATGPSSADGTRLQIWDCFGSGNQLWTLPA